MARICHHHFQCAPTDAVKIADRNKRDCEQSLFCSKLRGKKFDTGVSENGRVMSLRIQQGSYYYGSTARRSNIALVALPFVQHGFLSKRETARSLRIHSYYYGSKVITTDPKLLLRIQSFFYGSKATTTDPKLLLRIQSFYSESKVLTPVRFQSSNDLMNHVTPRPCSNMADLLEEDGSVEAVSFSPLLCPDCRDRLHYYIIKYQLESLKTGKLWIVRREHCYQCCSRCSILFVTDKHHDSWLIVGCF